jgi:hypothetical protein
VDQERENLLRGGAIPGLSKQAQKAMNLALPINLTEKGLHLNSSKL